MKKQKSDIQREMEDSELIVITIGGCLFLFGLSRLFGIGAEFFIISLILIGIGMILNRFVQRRKLG